MSALTPVDDFIAQLLQHAAEQPRPAVRRLRLSAVLGAVLAEDIQSSIAVPSVDNSAMDGYALYLTDQEQHLASYALPVDGVAYAGQAQKTLADGTAMRIFTGASVPLGANTVVMQENCQSDAPSQQLKIAVMPKIGDNIRRMGQDIQQGQPVLSAGKRLDAADIGLLASIGCADVAVYEPLKISIVATGDELVTAGTPLRDGQIYNSNLPMLMALLQRLGVHMVFCATVADQPEALKTALQQAADLSDLILTSGGASVGDADDLKPVLAQIGAVTAWKVAIKPGKPVVWGHVNTAERAVPLLGLPGNPQSVWVTFLLLVLPYIKRLQGQTQAILPQSYALPAAFARPKAQGRREYLRVQVQQGQLVAHANQSSGVLSSAVWADGLAMIDVGQVVQVGDALPFLPFSGF